jgi:hypothetical protein
MANYIGAAVSEKKKNNLLHMEAKNKIFRLPLTSKKTSLFFLLNRQLAIKPNEHVAFMNTRQKSFSTLPAIESFHKRYLHFRKSAYVIPY